MSKSLLIAAMFGMSVAASAQQTFTHITIKSGFNQDVICEDKDRITETTTQSDAPDLQGIDGSGFAFFTTSVQTNGAMCGDDGLFKSSRTGATFKVMPTQLNALVLKGTKKTTIAGNSVVIPVAWFRASSSLRLLSRPSPSMSWEPAPTATAKSR